MTELVRITLDERHAVVRVGIPRLDDRLRDASYLAAAFEAAYADAVAAGLPEPTADRAGTARRTVARAHPPLRELVQQALGEQARGGRRELVRPASAGRRGGVGVSRNECVEVTLSPAGSAGTFRIDQGWLNNAEARNVADAITQAFEDAYQDRSAR